MQTATGTTLITHGQLVDGTGRPAIPDGAVLIRDGRIVYAGPATALPDSPAPRRVLLASPRGYCAGVDRAVVTVEKALELYGPPVYVLHEIVRLVDERLDRNREKEEQPSFGFEAAPGMA